MIKSIFFLLLILCFQCVALVAQNQPDTAIVLPGVEIFDKAPPPIYKTTIIQGKDLVNGHEVDMGEFLRTIPNVNGIRRGGYAIDPVIRGLRFGQVRIFLDDGTQIEGGCPNRMDPVLTRIEPEDIHSLEIVRGPYLLRYGPSLGSTIRVISRAENPYEDRKFHVKSFTGFEPLRKGFGQHLKFYGSSDTFFYQLSGGYKSFGDYTDGNNKAWDANFTKYSISADVGVKLAHNQKIEVSYKGSFARNVMFAALPMDENADNANIVALRYEKKSQKNLGDNFLVSAYYSKVYHEMDNRHRPQYSTIVPPNQGIMQAVAIANTQAGGLHLAIQRQLKSLLLVGGCDLDYKQKDGSRTVKMIMNMGDFQTTSVRNFNLWKDAYMLNSGVFISLSSPLKPARFSAALRADINHGASADTLVIIKDNHNYFKSTPQTCIFWSTAINGSWQAKENLKFTVGIGRGARPPDLQERYIKFLATGFDRYDYLGNPRLDPEINYQADLTVDFTTSNTNFYTNLFRSEILNFITGTLVPPTVARPQSMGAPGVKQFNNLKKAIFYGFEVGFRSEPLVKLNTSLSAGYTYAYFPEIEKILLQNGQAVGTELLTNDPVPEMPALEGNLKVSYRLLKNRLEPLFEVRAVGPQKQVSQASYEESTPGYIIAGTSMVYQPFNAIRLMAGISNIFDKAYYEHLNRRMIGTTGKLFEQGRSYYFNLTVHF